MTDTAANNAPVAPETGSQGSGTTSTPAETNAPESAPVDAGEEVQGNLFDNKPIQGNASEEDVAKAKAAEATDEGTKEPEGKAEAEAEEAKPEATLEEMGYGDVMESQKALAGILTEAGIDFNTLDSAIDGDSLDISKLGELDDKTAMLIKTSVEAEIVKMKAVKAERRSALYEHVGGEAKFKAMTDWVNKEAKSNPAFQKEATELYGLMKLGGKQAELAAKEVFNRFSAAPNTSLLINEESAGAGSSEANLSKRERLDKGWESFRKANS